jgi:hypothetical protein
MLNFAEQTGSGAIMIVWSFLDIMFLSLNMNKSHTTTIDPNSDCVALSYPSQSFSGEVLMLME